MVLIYELCVCFQSCKTVEKPFEMERFVARKANKAAGVVQKLRVVFRHFSGETTRPFTVVGVASLECK